MGDTLFAFLNNTISNIVAIEPEKSYFEILERNVMGLNNIDRKRVTTVSAFISSDEKQWFTLEVHKGTAERWH